MDSNQEDNEFTPFRNIINEWYAKDTSKKIRAVKRSKGMAGEHIGSHPPYGYMKNPENKKEWIIDEEAAEVVREIFRLCVGGYGPTQIANILTERKILCPTYYALEKGGKPRTALPADKFTWNGPVVAKILDRMDYLGHTVNFKTHVKSYKVHKTIYNSPDQWKVFEGTHEAIIDKETFEIVQKIRAGKRRPTRMGEMPMFSGLLYCADCGRKLSFHRKADESADKHHYLCENYRSNTANCTMHYICLRAPFMRSTKTLQSWRTCSAIPASRQRASISWNPVQNTNVCSTKCIFFCKVNGIGVPFMNPVYFGSI